MKPYLTVVFHFQLPFFAMYFLVTTKFLREDAKGKKAPETPPASIYAFHLI
jgi:hypothetical protein